MHKLVSNKQHSFFSNLAAFACALAFVVILLGAYTRLTNAGLSCPDWPHCYGYLTAPHTNEQIQAASERYPMTPVNTTKAWTEMTHRYVAGTEGLIILVLAGIMLFKRSISTRKLKFIAISLLILLVVQVLLGMLTVTALLKPIIVLSHLVTGISLLCLLWWTYLETRMTNDGTRIKHKKRASCGLLVGLVIVALQIMLGGWVSTHYAGLACIDFPYCNGQLIPTMQWGNLNTDLITIHMLHRFGALVTAIYIGLLSLFLLRNANLRCYGMLLLLLLVTQLTLGILNILWLRPVWLALAHHGVAILLLLTMIATLIKASTEQVTT